MSQVYVVRWTILFFRGPYWFLNFWNTRSHDRSFFCLWLLYTQYMNTFLISRTPLQPVTWNSALLSCWGWGATRVPSVRPDSPSLWPSSFETSNIFQMLSLTLLDNHMMVWKHWDGEHCVLWEVTAIHCGPYALDIFPGTFVYIGVNTRDS